VIIGSLLASMAALPLPVLALGLGKLTVLSGLGQPLSAQIELTSAQREELDSLRARVADPSTYRDNNVQYSPALGRARVTLEQGSNGTPYLRISTTQAVNDPFLDLIIELSWATGRVVRDYTFLLDPPGGETQAVEPAPAIVAQPAPARAPRGTRRGEAGAAASSGAAAPASSAGAAASGAGATTADASGNYTVKRGDTLSKIARDNKPDNVSLEQMLVALFRSNESAFDGRNMNRLRTGQIITIPPGDQAAAITQADAAGVVKAQSADWRAYRDRVAAAAPTTDTTTPRQATGGRIGTVVEDKTAPAAAGSDKLMVSRAAGGAGGAGSAKAEDAAAKDKALREANERVAELEKTVRDLQRAAELRNQTMADLQARAGELNKGKAADATKSAPAATAPATPAPMTSTTTTPPAATAPAPASPPASTLTPVAPTPATATAPAPVAPATPAPATPAATAPSAAPSTPPAASAPAPTPATTETKPAEATPPPAPAPKVATPPKKVTPEPSFLDDLIGNTPTWAMAAVALVVVAGIAGLVAARRRKTTKFEDSIISGTDIKTNTVFGSTGGGVVNTGDNSLASDFSREGLGNIDTDEVDPIAEAEVYLAYGRDAQAEEILKDALKKDSQRQEIYLKLLEIHSQHNKPSAFETVASELYSVSGGQGEVWQKATALGRQLDPTNPMYGDAGAPAPHAAAAEAGHVDTDIYASATEHKPEHKPEPPKDSSLDFNLDEDISLSPTSGATAAPSPAPVPALEMPKPMHASDETVLNKPALVAGGAAVAAAAAAALARTEKAPPVHEAVSFEPESVPKFDLDFHLDEPPPSLKGASAKPVSPSPEPAMAVAGGAPAPQLARPAAAIELDKLDLAFDPARSTFEDPTPSVLDGQWHDAATKLDLAKAYQEMGDVEGAREILQEVLHEGDDQQKTEAQALMGKLA
jgi:pilus assembly protein FimV